MMKRKLMSVVAILMFSVIFGLFSKDQALAYWSVSKDGKTQCFAIQYKYASKYKSEGRAAQDGNVSDTRTSAQLYSTKKICGTVDANGNLSGKVTIKGFPDSTSHIVQTDEKLGYSISNKGDTYTLTISTCSKSGYACENGSAVTKTTYEIKKGEKFESFAESAFNGAPGKYGINAKAEFKKNETRDTVKEEAEAMNPGESSNDGDGSLLSNVKETCANQGGAQSLGWILCPIMELIGEASDHMYEEYVEPALRVDPKLFSDDNQSVRIGWNTFRDIANIIFVILLLVVIFSQLTGVGIDNYGIKKILPKLIVAAVLINLSFIICVLAVDISNILGNSFQALFNELGNTLPTAEDIEIADNSIITGSEVTAGGRLASVGILSSAVVAGGAMWANPAIILSLFVSAIGVVISIVFLFIILATRGAAVVVLIVVSPVAMVCYMLPNAKKIFDKWLKGFEGLLLVYPICGLLVGGGDYVAKLLLTSGFIQKGFISAFTAMIAGIVPIFFIPMVLKNSFAALGNLGSMISNVGRGMSRGVTGRIREGGVYKNAQESGRMRQTRIRAGVDAEGNARSFGRIGTIMRGGKRNLARNRAQYLKDQEFNDRADSLAGVGMDAAIIGQQKRAEAEDLSNYMTLINDKTRNGEDEAALYQLFDEYMAAGNKSGAVAVARIAGRRKDTAANFIDNKLTNPGMSYNPGMLQSVAKEVATGENSGTYRAASPLGFEFASQINKAQVGEGGGLEADTNYANWSGQSENVKSALDHHVTNSAELVGMKNSSLDEIANMMESGQMDQATMQRLGTLAQSTIANRGMGPWDSTKEGNLNRIARFANTASANGGTAAGGTSIDVPHGRGSTPTNIGGGGGADFVSE